MNDELEEKIRSFYKAFDRRDYKSMNAIYADKASFRDEIFELQGKQVLALWYMMVSKDNNLKVTCNQVEVKAHKVTAHWTMAYNFTVTGRPIINNVVSVFEFEGGKVVKQTDSYDFWEWTKQAFGVLGWVLGWSFYARYIVRKQALKSLKVYMQSKTELV